MHNVWRKTMVTVGIAVALMVGPGIGMANAVPLQIQPTQAELPDVEPIVDALELLPEVLEVLFPEPEEPPEPPDQEQP
jgi:hypothetical protein